MSETESPGEDESPWPIISFDELRSLPLGSIISDGATIDCYDIHTQLQATIKELDASGSNQVPAVKLLSAICCIHDKFNDAVNPYGPMMEMDGKRTMIPSDLKGKQSDELAAFVPLIENLSLKARIADIVWLNNRQRRDLAEIAVDAYVQRVTQYLDGSANFRTDLNSAIDFRAIDLLKRAFQISKSVKGKADHNAELVGAFKRMVEIAFSSNDIGSVVRLTRLGMNFGIIDELALAVRIEAFFLNSEVSDPHWQKKALEQLQRIYRRAGDEAKANDCQLRIAECSVAIADAMAGSSMASAHWLMTAIGELRQASGPIARDRAKALRKLLKERQEDSLFEMGVISHSTDISEIVNDTISKISGLSLGEALGVFASLHRSSSPQQLREQAKKSIQEHPLSSMFGGTHVDDEGKVIAKNEGAGIGDQSSEDALLDHILRDMRMLRSVVVRGVIDPARRHIQYTLPLTENAFELLVAQSPFVPPYHAAIFSLGFARFFQGDMLSAGSLLIPQFENSMRYLLKLSGRDPSTIKDDLTQDDRSISTMLQHERGALEAIFGEDIVFEIDALFNRRPGPALRHEMAHGKLSAGEYYSDDVVYACWFMFRMICLPLFDQWDDICAQIQKGEF